MKFDPITVIVAGIACCTVAALHWSSNEMEAAPEINRYGIEIEVTNDAYDRVQDVKIVRAVKCLKDQGIHVGDKIIAVNNVPVRNLMDQNFKFRKEKKHNRALAPYYEATDDLIIQIERVTSGMMHPSIHRIAVSRNAQQPYRCAS